MTSLPFSLTIDAADPRGLGTFWCRALGYVEEPPPPPHTTWEEALLAWELPREQWNDAYAIIDPAGVGPRIFLQKVPEAKTAKNRLHIDVRVSPSPDAKDRDGIRAKADELLAGGATQTRVIDEEYTGHWIVMADPEGNEFCII